MLRSMVKEGHRRNTNNSSQRSLILSKSRLAVDGIFARPLPIRPSSSKIDATLRREKR